MSIFSFLSCGAMVASSLPKAVLVVCLLSLTACMTPPKIASQPTGTQPEFLYTPNIWEHHKPYDIMRRAMPIIAGINSAVGSISQSMSNAYNIQADHIAAENQRRYQSYQYSNQLYQNKLQLERQKKIQRLQALETQDKSANPESRAYIPSGPVPEGVGFLRSEEFRSLMLDSAIWANESGKAGGASLRRRVCRTNPPGYQERLVDSRPCDD